MAAIARALSRMSRIDVDVETLKTVVIFCGVGLLVSLFFASYGLDFEPWIFLTENPPGVNRWVVLNLSAEVRCDRMSVSTGALAASGCCSSALNALTRFKRS
jgi:hypothetical protein